MSSAQLTITFPTGELISVFCAKPRSVSSDACITPTPSADVSSTQVYISTAALTSTFETRMFGVFLLVMLSAVSPVLLPIVAESRLGSTEVVCTAATEL